jgi:hypothetical protein
MKNIKVLLFSFAFMAGLFTSCGNGGNEAKPKDSLSSPAPARPAPVDESNSLKVDSLRNDTIH